jgi:hypothetical protein
VTTQVLVLHNVDSDAFFGWQPEHHLVPVWTTEWPDGYTDAQINRQIWQICNVGDDPDFPPGPVDPDRKLALAYRHKATVYERGIRSLSSGDAVVITDDSPDPVRAYPLTRELQRRWTVADFTVTESVPEFLEGLTVLDADALRVWRILPGTRDKLLDASVRPPRPELAHDAASRGSAPMPGRADPVPARDGHRSSDAPAEPKPADDAERDLEL